VYTRVWSNLYKRGLDLDSFAAPHLRSLHGVHNYMYRAYGYSGRTGCKGG